MQKRSRWRPATLSTMGLAVLALGLGWMASPAEAQPVNRPNILFIMGDDHLWPGYGFMAKIDRRQAPWDAGNASVDDYFAESGGRGRFQHPDFPALDADTPPSCEPLVDCGLTDGTCDRSCDTGTPSFDWLASRGAVFPVGYVTQPHCIESFRSLLTGLYATQFHAKGSIASEPMMGHYLVSAGYLAMGYGKIWQKSYRDIGFDAGEDMRFEAQLRANALKGVKGKAARTARKSYLAIGKAGDRTKFRARRELGALGKFLEIYYDPITFASDPPPWFMFYSPHLPHSPFGQGKGYQRESPSDFPGKGGNLAVNVYGNIRVTDERIGDVMRELAKYGALDDTLIFYLNDNGFLLPNSKFGDGENGVRTPILVSGPGIAPNQVMPQLVHAVDVLPTMMDYACEGLAPGQCLMGSDWAGQSMRPFLEPSWGGVSMYPPEQNGAFTGRRYLFAGWPRPLNLLLHSFDGYHMLFYPNTSGKMTMYDVVNDPDQLQPITRSDLPEVWDRLEAQMLNRPSYLN